MISIAFNFCCRHGQHIPNSPFKIYVGESEIGNASKVKVSGKGLTEGMANELNEFFVNTKDAGMCVKYAAGNIKLITQANFAIEIFFLGLNKILILISCLFQVMEVCPCLSKDPVKPTSNAMTTKTAVAG